MDARLRAMGRVLARVHDAEPALDLSAQRARFLQHALQPAPQTRARGWAYGTLAVALLGLGMLILRPAPSAPRGARLAFDVAGSPGPASGWVSAPANASLPLRFPDGSALTLASRSRARVVETSADGALVVLEQGQLSAHVLHRPGTDYRFKAGPFEVRVIGTRFDLSWDHAHEQFALIMHEGAVQVQGPSWSETRTFRAGERVIFAPEARDARSPGAPAPHAATDAGEAISAVASVARPRSARARTRSEAEELARAAEAARFGGRPEQAAEALRALRARFAGDAQTRESAFLLGRVYFDQLAAPAEAARWFQTYLRERPAGAFAREASGRLIESFVRLADRAAARDAARAYLAHYPDGPHAELARQLTATDP